MTSKLLFTALALAALIATPALAKKPVHHAAASAPYASVAAPVQTVEGRPVADPDANVRLEIQRDYATSLGVN